MKVLNILCTSDLYSYEGWNSQHLRTYGDESSLLIKTIKNYEDSLKAGNHCSAMHFILYHINEETREVTQLMNEVKKIPLKKRIEINKPPVKTAKKKSITITPDAEIQGLMEEAGQIPGADVYDQISINTTVTFNPQPVPPEPDWFTHSIPASLAQHQP